MHQVGSGSRARRRRTQSVGSIKGWSSTTYFVDSECSAQPSATVYGSVGLCQPELAGRTGSGWTRAQISVLQNGYSTLTTQNFTDSSCMNPSPVEPNVYDQTISPGLVNPCAVVTAQGNLFMYTLFSRSEMESFFTTPAFQPAPFWGFGVVVSLSSSCSAALTSSLVLVNPNNVAGGTLRCFSSGATSFNVLCSGEGSAPTVTSFSNKGCVGGGKRSSAAALASALFGLHSTSCSYSASERGFTQFVGCVSSLPNYSASNSSTSGSASSSSPPRPRPLSDEGVITTCVFILAIIFFCTIYLRRRASARAEREVIQRKSSLPQFGDVIPSPSSSSTTTRHSEGVQMASL